MEGADDQEDMQSSPRLTRLTERVVLEALAQLGEQSSGSTISALKGVLSEQHPGVSLDGLPIVLRNMEKNNQITKTPQGRLKTTIAGRVADTPEHLLRSYYSGLFRISDPTETGMVTPKDFLQLLKMSGFCLRASQLREIADSTQTIAGVVSNEGNINYMPFMSTLIAIVKRPVTRDSHVGESRAPANDTDWQEFEAALSSLTLGGDDEGEDV